MNPGNLNLYQKGLIIVAVPLLFELAFVGSLALLLRQTEAVAEREAVSKKIIFAADRLNRTFFNCAVALFTYSTTDNPEFLQRFGDLTEKLPKEIESLKAGMHNDPAQRAALGQIEAVSSKTSEILAEVNATLIEQGSAVHSTHISDLSTEFASSLVQIQQAIGKLTEAESEIVRTSPEIEKEKRQAFEKVLVVGVIANIALAIALVYFFTENIIRRLRILSENTAKFTNQERLHPPLDGNEEIAQLDKSFHEMASSLIASREKERALQKMKEELLAVVGHDLRSPLTSISLSLSFIKMGGFGQLSERLAQSVATCEDQVFRLMRMIHDLLDFEKLQSGTIQIELQETTSAKLIEAAVQSVAALSKEHGVAVHVQASEILLKADEDGLIRVLTNLLSNAIKFSPPGGTVTVDVLEGSDDVEFRVIDQGPGVPVDYRNTVFERYKQVQASDHKKKKGIGLGLAICKGLVEDHGGAIGVSCPESGGSTFWFKIPKQA